MHTAVFSIPHLDEIAEVTDLGSILLGISGVGHARFDVDAHNVSVEYDPDYVTADFLARTIKGAGYPQTGSPADGDAP